MIRFYGLHHTRLLLLTLSLAVTATAPAAVSDKDYKCVSMHTSKGTIGIALDFKKAPKTVENFMQYVKSGFYAGTVFHRVISNFMIQGGGWTAAMTKKPTRGPVRSESDNGLKNRRGTIAMARTSDPHSATAQFFINVVDNAFLDFKSKTPQGWGYTVFGHVVTGMDVVDKIRYVETGPGGPMSRDVPLTPVHITKVVQVSCSKLK